MAKNYNFLVDLMTSVMIEMSIHTSYTKHASFYYFIISISFNTQIFFHKGMCYWVYLSKVFLCTWQQSSKFYSFVFHRRFKYYGYHIYGVVRSIQKQLFGRKKNCVSPLDLLLHYCMTTKPLSGVKAPSILIEIEF